LIPKIAFVAVVAAVAVALLVGCCADDAFVLLLGKNINKNGKIPV
jgi:hypothetical protein